MAEQSTPTQTSFPWRAIAIAALRIVVAMAVRSTLEHDRAYKRAVELDAAGDLEEAIVQYRWALRWHTPWGPWHKDAAAALWRIGEQAEAERPLRAVQAFDALRSGLIASRSFYQPQAEVLAKANARMPALLVRVAERRADTRDKVALLKRFKADYSRPVGVPLWASIAVSLGFLLWVGGLLFAFTRGVDETGKLRSVGWRGVGASVAGFACWALAMWLA